MPYTDPKKKREYDRQRYAEKRDHLLEQQKRYYLENKQERQAYAKKYAAEKQKEKRDYVLKLKEQPCMDCGNSFHFSAMDFDHREGEQKKGAITDMMRNMRVTLKRLIEEIAKCDLVCANCHRVRTYERMKDD